jgi:glycogen phosphorylase
MSTTYTNLPSEIQSSDTLAQLALDLRWSWNHSADELWQRLDPELWDLTHNPWVILQTISGKKLESISADPTVEAMVNQLVNAKRTIDEAPAWFQKTHPNSSLKMVAYFSMEYMLSEALPIYSGGLGNVAGDQLKSGSDLGVPVVAVGLLFQQGYFRQEVDPSGAQIALYPFNDPGQLPIRPLRDGNGDWVRLPIALPGSRLWIRTWEVQVGRTKLYLLDTNDPANLPNYRCITSELYGGGSELRLRQEAVLGIAGWRLLRALRIHPEVCHLNEGHAAFAVLERARGYMEDTGQPFQVALTITRAGNLFTTHTPVEAGFDRFAPELMRHNLSFYAEEVLKISLRDLMTLGRSNPNNDSEPFNMAYLAIRGSGSVNGVSRLHGRVSRRIFQPLFPRWPQTEVPVSHVTNGIHVPTWDSAEADRVWTEACGKGRWLGSLANVEEGLRLVEDPRLWRMRVDERKSLIEYTRKRYARQVATWHASPEEVAAAERIFDFNTLTLGFARRFATYKRPNLLLRDPDRLVHILTNRERPVQLILAGKAHPEDMAGQALIKQWSEFIRRPEVRSHAVFLSDYDMLLTERLVQGVDVWISTPRHPWEACGTSGMKVLVNGGLNLSELDGWWAEAYAPEVGWAIGDRQEHGEDTAWDAAEARALYSLLEHEIIPEFYTRNEAGIPTSWIARMRESMARLTPTFSANRTVREYTEEHYLAAAAGYAERAAQGGKLGAELFKWQTDIARSWKDVRFGWLKVETRDGMLLFRVQVHLGGLDPSAVRVELFADGQGGGEPFKQQMDRSEPCAGGPANTHVYSALIPAVRPADHFTPRIVPYHPRAFVPLEINQIVWQK